MSIVEHWRPVKGFEGLYEVSNSGNVRSLAHTVEYKTGGSRTYKERVLSVCKNNTGYSVVRLTKNKKSYMFSVHRLVAEAFLPNPDGLPVVNHKDESRDNNFVFVDSYGTVDAEKSNLEWCTYKYNQNYGTCGVRKSKNHHYSTQKVLCYTVAGKYVCTLPSVREAERRYHGALHVLKGRRKQAKGFVFYYEPSGIV